MKKQLKKSLAVLLAAALFATTANLVAFNDGAATAFAEEAPGSVTSNDVTSGEGSGSTPSTPTVLPENPTPQQLAEALTITMDENYVVSMSSPYDSSKYNSYGFMFYLNDERIVIHANLGFYLGQWGVSYTISEHKGLMNASGTYQFRVALFDSTQVDEVASQVSNEVTYTLPSERLASPVMSCADNKVKWQPVEGASGYLVYEEGYSSAEGIWYNTAGANNCFYMPAVEGQPLELSHASIIDWFRNGYRVKVIAVSEDMDAVANSAPSIYTVVEANDNVYYLPSSDDTPSYSPATSMISEEEIPTFTETSLGAMPARIDVVTSAAAAEGIAALEAAYGAEVNASSVSVGREYIPVELPETGLFSAVDISFAIRGEQIHELGFELPLTLAVPVALEDKELAVIHVLNDGGLEQLPVTRDEEGNATFVTTSLSVFILMSKEDADKIVAASPVAAGGSYVVKKGDCLSKIAVKFSTTIAKLLKLNTGIKDANKIYTGQKIKVK